MNRLLVLLVALLLPLQFAWGAAAAYCGHEAAMTTQRQHVGHHSHVHEQGQAQPQGKQAPADLDCNACHAGHIVALPVMTAGAMLPSPAGMPPARGDLQRASAPQRAPDRPQWPRLVV